MQYSSVTANLLGCSFCEIRRRCLSVLKLKNFERKYQSTASFKTKYQTSKLSLWTVVATAVAARAVVVISDINLLVFS